MSLIRSALYGIIQVRYKNIYMTFFTCNKKKNSQIYFSTFSINSIADGLYHAKGLKNITIDKTHL